MLAHFQIQNFPRIGIAILKKIDQSYTDFSIINISIPFITTITSSINSHCLQAYSVFNLPQEQSIRQLRLAGNADAADVAAGSGIAVDFSFWPRLHFQLLVARRCLKREVGPAQGDTNINQNRETDKDRNRERERHTVVVGDYRRFAGSDNLLY